jgi:hypothetical protein
MSISSINSSASNIYSQGIAQSASVTNETSSTSSAQSTSTTTSSSDSVSISSQGASLSKASTEMIQLQPYDANKFLTEGDKQLLGMPSSDMMTNCMAQEIASLRESGALKGAITSSTVQLGPNKIPTDLFSLFSKDDLPKMANLKNKMEKNFAQMNKPNSTEEQDKFNAILNIGNDAKAANTSLMAKRLKDYSAT